MRIVNRTLFCKNRTLLCKNRKTSKVLFPKTGPLLRLILTEYETEYETGTTGFQVPSGTGFIFLPHSQTLRKYGYEYGTGTDSFRVCGLKCLLVCERTYLTVLSHCTSSLQSQKEHKNTATTTQDLVFNYWQEWEGQKACPPSFTRSCSALVLL
jgi:hypothetical protein